MKLIHSFTILAVLVVDVSLLVVHDRGSSPDVQERAIREVKEEAVERDVKAEEGSIGGVSNVCPDCSVGFVCCPGVNGSMCCEQSLKPTEDREIPYDDIDIVRVKRQSGYRKCPPDFHYQPASRKCYRLEMQRSEWEIARMRCQRRHSDAHLVVIDDAAEQAAVVDYLKSIKDTDKLCVDLPNRVFVWAAGQRASPWRESTFVWKPNNYRWSEMTYSNWNSGEPNYRDGREECLEFFPDLLWNDAECIAERCPLCEIDL